MFKSLPRRLYNKGVLKTKHQDSKTDKELSKVGSRCLDNRSRKKDSKAMILRANQNRGKGKIEVEAVMSDVIETLSMYAYTNSNMNNSLYFKII
jgi:hypothetical protein